MFTADEIEARIRETPFVPVRIVITSGQKFDIRHPDLIMIGRRSLIIGTASEEKPTRFDQITRVPILHVTALQDLPVPTPPSANGPQ